MAEQNNPQNKKAILKGVDKLSFQLLYNFFIMPFVRTFRWFHQRAFKKHATEQSTPESRPAQVEENKTENKIQEEPSPIAPQVLQASQPIKVPATIEVLDTPEATRKILYKAVENKQVYLAQACLEEMHQKMNRAELSRNPSILLYKAIESGHLGMLELLVNYGVRLDFVCMEHVSDWSNQYSAVYLAVHMNHIHVAQFLLEHKQKITEAALQEAYKTRSQSLFFKLFLDTNALTFYPDSKKNHTFYFLAAIEEGHYETVKRTLESLKPSKTTLYDNQHLKSQNSSIIELAISHGHTEIAQLLLNYRKFYKKTIQTDMFSYNEPRIFFCAVKNNNIEIARRLLKNHKVKLNNNLNPAWFDIRNDFGEDDPYYNHTALSYAVFKGYHEMVELLLESGAQLKERPYTSSQLKIIGDFSKRITFLSDQRLNHVRENLKPLLPSGPVELISDYAALPNYPIPARPKKV